MTIAESLIHLRQAAEVAGLPDASLDVTRILAFVLGKEDAWLRGHGLEPLEKEHENRARALLTRRTQGVPLAYLTEQAEFMGLPLHVSPAVLVPRPETETLVEHVLAAWPTPASVVDVGTGSGAISLALAKAWPAARVFATDASAEALSVAWANAKSLELDVTFLHGHLLDPLTTPVDAVIANLPYLTDDEMDLLPAELIHEPHAALAGGPSGDTLILELVSSLAKHLNAPGLLALEVHPARSEAIADVLRKKHPGATVGIVPDLLGMPRFIVASGLLAS